jgi:hypothetical protein
MTYLFNFTSTISGHFIIDAEYNGVTLSGDGLCLNRTGSHRCNNHWMISIMAGVSTSTTGGLDGDATNHPPVLTSRFARRLEQLC